MTVFRLRSVLAAAAAAPARPAACREPHAAHGQPRPRPRRRWHPGLGLGGATLLLAASGCTLDSDPPALNTLPAGVRIDSTLAWRDTSAGTATGADMQDLLTAGLGKAGLAATAPGFADATAPTAAELRRRAIWTNYRAILDISAAGGYGTLYGPNVASDGTAGTGDGKIPGTEWLAWAEVGAGSRVALMVQLPDSFDPARPCIIAAPSSGSRGVYGAIGSAGEWGLKRGCAVAYTDAGKGTGYHDLAADKVNRIDGRLVARGSLDAADVHFAASTDTAALAAYTASAPHRIAYKHLHSRANPERDWGAAVLASIRLALWAINERHAALDAASGRHLRTFTADNVRVIASSVSNGGGASLAAAEQDTEGLIDGVAVSEPNAQPGDMSGLSLRFDGTTQAVAGLPLVDYFSLRMLYEPCAAIAAGAQAANGLRPGWLGAGTAPLGNGLTQVAGVELATIAAGRCQSLADKGLISGTDTAAQAAAALQKLRDHGWDDGGIDALHASHYRLADFYVAWGYVVAYGRFAFDEPVCGLSLAAVDASGRPTAQAATQALLFSTGNGLNTGAEVIHDDSVGGARLYHLGVSASTGRVDGALDAQLCLRDLVTGVDTVTGGALDATRAAQSARVRAGLAEVRLSGRLGRVPTLIVAGRSDALLPVNHAGRAYAAYAQARGSSALRYVEVLHGQHFDGFLPAAGGVPGYDALFIPMHHYFNQAMDRLWAHLDSGTPLPPSQVVRPVPRGGSAGAAPAITRGQLPDIAAVPADADRIVWSGATLAVPR
ncbi:3-hydroxybutyrate oligomer hydrolase family protein [Pseudaquabacterium rugosum]|uniref:3-hydroxybutyrate oligomer hydrolase family protein n=1 Tax=Pseudaquabacterium rugosum TaxID=2984194 RepID=A0ABU9BC05_9BURK